MPAYLVIVTFFKIEVKYTYEEVFWNLRLYFETGLYKSDCFELWAVLLLQPRTCWHVGLTPPSTCSCRRCAGFSVSTSGASHVVSASSSHHLHHVYYFVIIQNDSSDSRSPYLTWMHKFSFVPVLSTNCSVSRSIWNVLPSWAEPRPGMDSPCLVFMYWQPFGSPLPFCWRRKLCWAMGTNSRFHALSSFASLSKNWVPGLTCTSLFKALEYQNIIGRSASQQQHTGWQCLPSSAP